MNIPEYIQYRGWTTQQYAEWAKISISQAYAHRNLLQKPHKRFILILEFMTDNLITLEHVNKSYEDKEIEMKSKMKMKEPKKMKKVMKEFKMGKLHSGSKKGAKVKSKKQAVAIGLSEARKAGEKVSKKKY